MNGKLARMLVLAIALNVLSPALHALQPGPALNAPHKSHNKFAAVRRTAAALATNRGVAQTTAAGVPANNLTHKQVGILVGAAVLVTIIVIAATR